MWERWRSNASVTDANGQVTSRLSVECPTINYQRKINNSKVVVVRGKVAGQVARIRGRLSATIARRKAIIPEIAEQLNNKNHHG